MTEISKEEFWDALRSPAPTDRSCKNCAHWKDKMGCQTIAYDVMKKCHHHTRYSWAWDNERFNENFPDKSYWKWDDENY